MPEGDQPGLDPLPVVALDLQHRAVTCPPGATVLLQVLQQGVKSTGATGEAGHEGDGLAASTFLLALDAGESVRWQCRAGRWTRGPGASGP